MTPERKDKQRCKVRYRQSMSVLNRLLSLNAGETVDISSIRPTGPAITRVTMQPLHGPMRFGCRQQCESRDHEVVLQSRDFAYGSDDVVVMRTIHHPRIMMYGLEFACFESIGLKKYVAFRPDANALVGSRFLNIGQRNSAFIIRSRTDPWCTYLWDSTDDLLQAIKNDEAFVM